MLESLRTRFGTRGVAAGDAAVVVAVLLAGELRHNVDPIANPLLVAETVLPFLIGWVVFALVLDVYGAADVGGAIRRVAGAWVAGANVGLVARTSPALHGDVTWPFGVVVTGAVLVALLAWRAAAGR